LLSSADFKTCGWAGKTKNGQQGQAAIASDIVSGNSKWYFFMDGYDTNGKRQIGIATADSIFGPYKIMPDAVIRCGSNGSWNEQGCFYAKVTKYKDYYILFYDGRNKKGVEKVGMATSTDLIHWKDEGMVIDQHDGWRSSVNTTEPCYIETRGDSVFLMLAGYKEFKMGPWHHYVTRRMYMDVSGNVGDAQLGVFLSTDGGKSFIPHSNNPVFVNNYADPYENEHMGGNFNRIKTDSAEYVFYHAKSSFEGLKYNIKCRVKRKS
jgi:hypothetical protein